MGFIANVRRGIENPKEDIAAGHRGLGFLDAFSIGIGGIVGGGIFATLGIATVESRGATFISFLIGGEVALLTAYSYVKLSVAFPSKGGTVTFINKAFGPGMFSGSLNTLLVMSYVVLLAVYAYAFANYAAATFFAKEDFDFWHRVRLTGVMIVLALVNFAGPSLVEKSEGFFNFSKLLILLAFVVVGLAAAGLTFDRLGPSDWVPLPRMVAAGMLVFLSYEGFELIANVSDQVKNRERNLPLAYYGSVATAMVFYTLIIIVVLGHMTFEGVEGAKGYTLSAAAEIFMGRFGFVLLAIGAILATASAINAGLFGASKLPFMLAQAHEAGEVYETELGGRYPVGLFVITALVLLIANFVNLHSLSAATSTGFILVFLMVNVASARVAGATGAKKWVCITGAAVCAVALLILFVETAKDPENRRDLWFIGGLIALPVVYQILYRLSVRR